MSTSTPLTQLIEYGDEETQAEDQAHTLREPETREQPDNDIAVRLNQLHIRQAGHDETSLHEGPIDAPHGLYRPLNTNIDELRIILLKAGKLDEALDLRLLYWPEEHAKEQGYEAISYCWGDEYTDIQVDGHNLQVSVSAKLALQRFRHADRDRHLWMDSICLNQRDEGEKSYQVARMHHIYRGGVRTLIWMGEDYGTAQQAVDTIKILWEDVRQATDDFTSFHDVLDAAWFNETSTTDLVKVDTSPLIAFFSCQWFSRLWIVQEVALSKSSTMFCGIHEIDPFVVHRVAWWLLYKRNHLASDLLDNERAIRTAAYMTAHADVPFSWYHKELANAKPGSIWRDLLVDQQRYNVREPKDRVYSMLGMYQYFSGDASLPLLLQPDYARSLLEIYRDATRYAITQGSSDVLERVRRHCPEQHAEGSWPSWVPCWHHQTNESLDELGLSRSFEADGGWLQPSSIVDENEDTLIRYGFEIDAEASSGVQKLSGLLATGRDSDIDQLFAQIGELTGTTLNDAPSAKLEFLAETLLAGEDANHGVAKDCLDDLLALRDYRLKYRRYPPNINELSSDSPVSEADKRASRYCHAMWNAVGRRQFFVTESGRYGLGPQSMRTGDVVVILWGSKWPVVLRKLDESTAYEFIGICYVQGVMAGEAAEKFVEEDREATAFKIQ